LKARDEARYWSEIAICTYPNAPLGGFPSEYCHDVWCEKQLHHDTKKMYYLSEYEFAWWDLGGDNLALWRGQGRKKDSGGGNKVGTGTTAVGTGRGWG